MIFFIMIGVLRVFVESDGVLQASYDVLLSVLTLAGLKGHMHGGDRSRRIAHMNEREPPRLVVVAICAQELVVVILVISLDGFFCCTNRRGCQERVRRANGWQL